MKDTIILCTLENLKKIEKMGVSNFGTFNAFKLMIGTIAQESHFKYKKQLGNGPAMSYFQVEPQTAIDIIKNYIYYRKPLRAILNEISDVNERSTYIEVEQELFDNFTFACFIARLVYYRADFKKLGFNSLNEIDQVNEMAVIWKAIYNTVNGKGKESEFIENFERFNLDLYDIKYYNDITK